MAQLHPEELFELERQASLTESERALRDQHLASCQTCRIEHGLRADFAREPLHRDDDRALLERALGGALADLAAPARSGSSRKAWAVTALGVLVAGLAAAAVRSSGPRDAASPPARAVAPAQRAARSAEVASAARSVEVAQPNTESLPPASAVVGAEPTRRAVEPSSSDVPRANGSASSTSAAALFAQANAARRAGKLPEASLLYRKLLGKFGDSREAQTSSVILGRLLLDSGDSASEALALFERYTYAAPTGNLAEEALLGRAEALARLGRPANELEAWRSLLEQFPQTAQRERARARVAALSAPP